MVKKIKLDSKHSVELSGSAGWFLVYRANFGQDILPDLLPMINAVSGFLVNALQGAESMEVTDIIANIDTDALSETFIALAGLEIMTLFKITWAMAKNANDDVDPFEEWMSKLEKFPIDTVVPELFNIILETSVSTKNSRRLRSLLKKKSGSRPSSQEQSKED